ncbi:MAG TPA: thioredoxin domain-containing protein [Candidatus Bathyarchaeia archaeon]|nr:thioredoxin domain-containing protein [Candidatus Bathyarchaeia archaeon]
MRQSEMIHEVIASNFREEVVNSSVPVVIEFYADWCPICHALELVIQGLAEYYAWRAKFVRIDTDAEPEIVTVYGIKRRPTLVIIKNGIDTRERIIGFNPESFYKNILDRILLSATS